jgi:hypothetical protein
MATHQPATTSLETQDKFRSFIIHLVGGSLLFVVPLVSCQDTYGHRRSERISSSCPSSRLLRKAKKKKQKESERNELVLCARDRLSNRNRSNRHFSPSHYQHLDSVRSLDLFRRISQYLSRLTQKSIRNRIRNSV